MGGSFHCEDPSIRYPYQGDTVSTKSLLCIVIILVNIIVFTTEIFQHPEIEFITVCKKATMITVHIFLRFWVSLTFNVFLNMALKTLTAVPRPHFLATCQMKWEKLNCTTHGGNVDIDISLCQGYGDDPDSVYDAIKSFPSGHAQVSCFAAAFTIVYLQDRLRTQNTFLLRYWLELVLVVMALFSSTSRVADHRHHVLDVVVGGAIGIILGAIAALDTIIILVESYEEEEVKKESSDKQASKLKCISSGFGAGLTSEKLEADSSLS